MLWFLLHLIIINYYYHYYLMLKLSLFELYIHLCFLLFWSEIHIQLYGIYLNHRFLRFSHSVLFIFICIHLISHILTCILCFYTFFTSSNKRVQSTVHTKYWLLKFRVVNLHICIQISIHIPHSADVHAIYRERNIRYKYIQHTFHSDTRHFTIRAWIPTFFKNSLKSRNTNQRDIIHNFIQEKLERESEFRVKFHGKSHSLLFLLCALSLSLSVLYTRQDCRTSVAISQKEILFVRMWTPLI